MKDSSGSYSNPTQIATKFNNFFANVGPSLANKISPTQITYREFLIGHYAKCFYLNPTSPTEVANIVHFLKNSKCEGFDGLCISPIKDTIDLIAALLTHICNLSFAQGVFPDKLKTAKILPSSNVMTLPCSLTTSLFLFSPVFPRSSKNSFTSDCLDFLKNLTFFFFFVQGATMAATFSGAFRLFTIFSVLLVLNAAQDSYNYHSTGVESPWLLKHILSKSTMPKYRVRRPVVL